LQAAIDFSRGELDLRDALDDLEARVSFAAGEVKNGALISLVTLRVIEYPRFRSLLIELGAGRSLIRLLPFVQDFARRQRCARIEARCRKSVGTLFARNGFRVEECVPLLSLEE
jgi:hypothetical protein